MLNTTSITLPGKLTTTQKAARGVIFQCLQKMEMGCLTIIESFHTETKERSERFTAPNGEYSGQPVVATIEVKHPGFYSEYYKAVASLPVRRTWMAGGTVQI